MKTQTCSLTFSQVSYAQKPPTICKHSGNSNFGTDGSMMIQRIEKLKEPSSKL